MSDKFKITVYKKLQLLYLLINKDQRLLSDMQCLHIPSNTIAVFINDLRWCISRMNPATLVNTDKMSAYGFRYKLGAKHRQRIIVFDVNRRQFIVTLGWAQNGKNTRDSHLTNLHMGILERGPDGNCFPVDSEFLHGKVDRLRNDHSVFFKILNKATDDLANAPSMGIVKTFYGQTLINWVYRLGESYSPIIETYREE